MAPRHTTPFVALALILGACSSAGEDATVAVPGADAGLPGVASDDDDPVDTDETASTDGAETTDDTPATDGGNDPDATDPSETTTGTDDDADTADDGSDTSDPTTTASTTTSSTTSTTTTSTTTTTTVPPLDVFDPDCVVEIQQGDSLGLIADRFDDETVDPQTLMAENDLDGETIYAGELLDVCVDNGLDDITGEERTRNQALVDRERRDVVIAQQEKLNELFAGTGIRELLVDGVSGPVTRQRLCAARLSLGLPVTRDDMEAGSDEEQVLMEAEELLIPFTTAAMSERWVLIDRTCQIMFVGTGAERLDFVFPTSTGEAEYRTRDQDRSRVFRYDPASGNGGWHNSTTYPVAVDNPLNGNMYKPLYFDGGQAIHGANNVPTSPQSKGCARLRVDDQQRLVEWLGLGDLDQPTTSSSRINLTVNVQGAYVPG